MSSIFVETPATVEPLSLAEVKAELGFGPWNDSDHQTESREAVRVRRLITAAREYCETFTRRSFVTKGYVQYLDSPPQYTDTIMGQDAYPPAYYSLPRYSTSLWNYSQMIKLLRSPVVSVDHITYISSATGRPMALQLGYPPWFPLETYTVGSIISDSNGNQQSCATTGKTGAVEPAWATTPAATTSDGTAVWTCGAAAPNSDYIVDTSAEPGRIFPRAGQFWPAVMYVPRAIQIHFTAGYGADGSKVPAVLLVAMRKLIALWDKDPSMMLGKSAPEYINALLWSERVADQAPTRG